MMPKDIIEKAIGHYGYAMQIVVAIEELSELQKALCKFIRQEKSPENKKDIPESVLDNIIEEIADCKIMLLQLEAIFSADGDVESQVQRKLARLESRMRG